MTKAKETDHTVQSKLYDTATSYGWISILMHWLTAVIVIALWIIGKRIYNGAAEESGAMRELHISIAACAWLVIFVRSVWRLRTGHPRINGQTTTIQRIAKYAHYTMVLSLLVMLCSGPLLAWSGGYPINVFDWVSLPVPRDFSQATREFVWFVHSNMSMLLLVLVLLHIGGALKHLMFHSDETVARMIWPGRRNEMDVSS